MRPVPGVRAASPTKTTDFSQGTAAARGRPQDCGGSIRDDGELRLRCDRGHHDVAFDPLAFGGPDGLGLPVTVQRDDSGAQPELHALTRQSSPASAAAELARRRNSPLLVDPDDLESELAERRRRVDAHGSKADDTTQVAFIFGPLPEPDLSSVTLLEEERLLAVRPEHPFAGRESVAGDELHDLPWLRVPAPRGAWPDFWFRRPGQGPVGPVIRTADEWVTAIEAGRGAAFTMPTGPTTRTVRIRAVVKFCMTARAAVLLAWRTKNPDPLVGSLREPRPRHGWSRITLTKRSSVWGLGRQPASRDGLIAQAPAGRGTPDRIT